MSTPEERVEWRRFPTRGACYVLLDELEAAEAENAKFREALGFYGDENNYSPRPPLFSFRSPVTLDGGVHAREALATEAKP